MKLYSRWTLILGAILATIGATDTASAQNTFVYIMIPSEGAIIAGGSQMSIAGTIGNSQTPIAAMSYTINDVSAPTTQRYANTVVGDPGSFFSLNFTAPTIPANTQVKCIIKVAALGANLQPIVGGTASIQVTFTGPQQLGP